MRFSLSLFCLLLALVNTGCKTAVTHVRWQHESPRSANEVALLRTQRSAFTGFTFVRTINGEPLLKEDVRDRVREIALLPGEYELKVAWVVPTPNGVAQSLADIPVSFVAEAGKVYQIRASSVEKTFGQSMRLALVGGVVGWTAWIVETNSGAVVGGVPRETPLKWHEK